MTEKISANSVIFVRTEIEASVALGSQVVKMAIIPPDTLPVLADWANASWDGDVVQALIGPGQTITLTANRSYVVWVKITNGSEIVELRAGGISTY